MEERTMPRKKYIDGDENIKRNSYFLQIAIFKLMLEDDKKTLRKLNNIIANTNIKHQIPINITTQALNKMIDSSCKYLRNEQPSMISGYFSYMYSQNLMFIQGLFRYIEIWLKKR